MWSKLKYFFWKITHRKLPKDLHKQVEVSLWMESHPLSGPKNYDEVYRDSKCDYCNCAIRDCSLCGSNAEG